MLDGESRTVGRVLIVCNDFGASRQLTDILQEHGLSVEVSVDVSTASARLARNKYEAVVIDLFLGHNATYFLQQIRNSASNRTAVTFAIATQPDDTAFALRWGFSFVLERPLTADSIGHTLTVAYGMIVRERRRYYRYPIVVPAVLQRKAGEIYARTINVSEGGMAIRSSMPLAAGSEANVEFTLVEPKLTIKAEGKVCWQNHEGEVGFAFGFMPFDMASALQQWLALKLERHLPTHVAEKFGRS